MRYTLNLYLGDLPGWAYDVVTAVLEEHQAVGWSAWGKGMVEVCGPNEAETRLACTSALERIGKRIEDVDVDLFA